QKLPSLSPFLSHVSALTIVLVGFTLLVAIVAGLVAWHMRRTQRRNEHQHGYGPPIVVFPRPSSTLITPATRRRAEPRAPEPRVAEQRPPEPRVAQPRPAEPPADATHVADPLAGGARIAEPRSPEVRSPSRDPIAA